MMSFKFLFKALCYTLSLLFLLNFTNAIAISPIHSRTISNGVTLRILPLGDSITWGYQSTDGNGYRLDLENLLSGNQVNYAGSQRAGTMPDSFNEGHPGATISQIAGYAQASLGERPNIVLLMAGTNDINLSDDVAGAPSRLQSLIAQIQTACPDATLLVALLPPIPAHQSDVDNFNAVMRTVLAQDEGSGEHIITVDMTAYVTAADLIDDLHPNDGGYAKMAQAWFAGIQTAAGKGWIQPPVETLVEHGACIGDLYWDPVYGTVASGVGSGDAPFSAGWNPVGQLASGPGTGAPLLGAGVRLADLNGDGKDDYIWIDPSSGGATLYINGGYSSSGIAWTPWGVIASGPGVAGADGAGVVFADINGDGLDDYLWISMAGDVSAFINGGPGSGGPGSNSWIWTPLGVITDASQTGRRGSIIFADIDGDGRADYHVVDPNGGLNSWLNTGNGNWPNWRPMGNIASGPGVAGADRAGVHLIDLNGDKRADYVWLDSQGAMTAFINMRGHSVGLAPAWAPVGIIATGVGTSRDNITFGDLDGNGNEDYVATDINSGAINVWLNTGSGARFQAGDLVLLADMDGDGHDDYVSMDEAGAITMYSNGGWNSGSNQWIWYPRGVIATGVGARREDIRIADLDGDGKADYLVVDAKSGAVNMWRNQGGDASGANWIWVPQGQIASGVGPGVSVRFADIDGDGKADYLLVDPSGVTTMYRNGGQVSGGWTWYPYGVIATGVGASRQDIHFADINGDGKADYLTVDRISGSTMAWRNGGGGPDNWIWYPQGTIATGVGANGLSIQFGNLAGNGRSDYLDVSPSSGAVSMWYNGCTITAPGSPVKGTPPPPGSGSLGPDSTCQDLQNYQGLTAGGQTSNYLQQSYWQSLDASDYITSWKQGYVPGSPPTFEGDFVSKWNIGQSFTTCSAEGGCQRPDCTGMGSQITTPKGAAAYIAAVSMTNVNLILQTLHEAVKNSQIQFATFQDYYQQIFDPVHFNPSPLWLSELLNGIATMMGIGAALTHQPEIEAGGVLAAGISNGIITYLTSISPTTTEVQTIAQLEKYVGNALTNTETELANALTDFLNKGTYGGADILNVIGDGSFADWRQIPILYNSISFVDNIYNKLMLAALINFAWHGQLTWVMSYPMTIDEFNNNYAFSGNNDGRLKHYYNGRGYFYMSIYSNEELFPAPRHAVPRVQDPPGWAQVIDQGIDLGTIIESSSDGFDIGGFGYSPSLNIGNVLINSHSDVQSNPLRVPGVFSIAQCKLGQKNPAIPVPGVKEFFESLSGPGAVNANNDKTINFSSFCYCVGIKDQNGKSFEDYLDLGSWPSHWCQRSA